jgi:hypothetical protein
VDGGAFSAVQQHTSAIRHRVPYSSARHHRQAPSTASPADGHRPIADRIIEINVTCRQQMPFSHQTARTLVEARANAPLIAIRTSGN